MLVLVKDFILHVLAKIDKFITAVHKLQVSTISHHHLSLTGFPSIKKQVGLEFKKHLSA